MASHRGDPGRGIAKRPNSLAHYDGARLDAAFRECGVTAGDILVAHVGMGLLGFPREGADEDSMFNTILGAYLKAIGPGGTLLVPTYTYSLARGEAFDAASTPSRIGPFSERFRKLPGVRRSVEPMFSVAGLGPAADGLFRDLPRECFGPDCIYERLEKAGAKICNVGVGFRYATYLLYVEQREAVPYRFLKTFTGTVMRDGRPRVERWLNYVRVLSDNGLTDLSRLESEAGRRGIFHRAAVGRGELTCIGCGELGRLASEGIAQDPWCLARGPAVDLEVAEARRVGEAASRVTILGENLYDRLLDLQKAPAYALSAACDAVLRALGAGLPMEERAYSSGSRVEGAVVPERWTPRAARLDSASGEPLLSSEENSFHLPYYCKAFEGELDLTDLSSRLLTHRDPAAVPWISKLFAPDWGLGCSSKFKAGLRPGRYRVSIDAAFSFGRLRVGHCVIPGHGPKALVLAAHHDHGGLANEGLSAAVVVSELFRRLARGPKRRWTYHLVLAPRVFGLPAFLNETPLDAAAVVLLESLGLDQGFFLQDPAGALPIIQKTISATWIKGDGPWLGTEDAARMRLPIVSLFRAPEPLNLEYPYQGFRSDLERRAVSPSALESSLEALIRFIDAWDGVC